MNVECGRAANLEGVGDGLLSVVDGLPINEAGDSVWNINKALEELDIATAGDGQALASVRNSLDEAQQRLTGVVNALQTTKDNLADYASNIGIAVPAAVILKRTTEYGNPGQKRQINFFRDLGDGTVAPENKPSFFADMHRSWIIEDKQRLIDRFPSDMTGLNIRRIRTFLDDMGFRRTDVIVVRNEQRGEVLRMLIDMKRLPGADTGHGFYVPDLDLSFVFRDRDLEEKNGAEFTESAIVHEKAHASSESRDIHILNKAGLEYTSLPRIGLSECSLQDDNRTTGLFWEEAFAEFVRSKYITDVLARPNGLCNWNGYRDGPLSLVPSKYFVLPGWGLPAVVSSSYAGAALDRLIAKDPEIFPALLRGRRDVTGIREVARRIDALTRPGTYEEISQQFNSLGSFEDGLVMICSLLS